MLSPALPQLISVVWLLVTPLVPSRVYATQNKCSNSEKEQV